MKLIHCADIHLDSPMETNLTAEKARERKMEVRSAFTRMVRYAEDAGVEAILIAGDLFDSTHVTKSTEKYVIELIEAHPLIDFYYLAGNHDRGSMLSALDARPQNLFLFGDTWTSYRREHLVLTGAAHPDEDTLSLSEEDVNIVVLHGQQTRGTAGAKEDVIRLSKLKGKYIDYVAMGHIHDYRAMKLDARGVACYSGCLEGRGFDECGEKGFVLLEIDGKRVVHRFVPFAARTLHTRSLEIDGIRSSLDLEEQLLKAVADIPAQDAVKVVLTGRFLPDVPHDLSHLRAVLEGRFYFSKVTDESRLLIRKEDYQNDISLKGEFVRRVLDSSMSDAEKERVIACGFRALSGEEIGL